MAGGRAVRDVVHWRVLRLVIAGAVAGAVISGCPPQHEPSRVAPRSDEVGRIGPQSLAAAPYRPVSAVCAGPGAWHVHDESVLSLKAASRPRTAVFELAPQEAWGQMAHRVQAGESPSRISTRYYGTSKHWRLIMENNKTTTKTPQSLVAGQLLYLPLDPLKTRDGSFKRPLTQPDYYVTAPGDDLRRVAKLFLGDPEKSTLLGEMNLNALDNTGTISPGTMLELPEE